MKKTAQVQRHPIKTSPRSIQLDQAQYQQYLNGTIVIYSPDAMLLESIGKIPKQEQRTEFIDQLSLIESLVVTSNGQLELSSRAVEGLATLLSKTQGLLQ